ncbi:MAG: cupin domain-containing protein [Planctomycetota bacterium]
MTEQAEMERTEHGLVPSSEGWFAVSLAEARWGTHERYGEWCAFEGKPGFAQVGINLHVLAPGQPNGMYHREDQQEDYLVLEGECLLLVEGDERRLRQWDFFHAAPGTEHIFLGAGDGPCAILMVGARDPDKEIFYPRNELALSHRAGVETEVSSPEEAHATDVPPGPAWAPDLFR